MAGWRHILLCSLLTSPVLLSGCGRDPRVAPPVSQVQDAIAAALPAHLTLLTLEQEPIPTSREDVKINFKATLEAAEELYTVERVAEGLAPVTLLRLTQPGGAQLTLYGQLPAHRLMDQWTLDAPQFQQDVRAWGQPHGAFGARAYPAGSAAAAAALRKLAADAEQMQQLQQTVTEQQERARQEDAERQARAEQERKQRLAQARRAFEEQHRQATAQQQQTTTQREQAVAEARQKWLAATAPGTRYLGTRLGKNNSTQRLALVFLEPKDARLRAEASNPDDPREQRLFTGELRFHALPEKNGAPAYPIVLHGQPSNKVPPEPNSIYERAVDLKLRLTAQGLDGLADAGLGVQFLIHLQRAGP